MKFVTTSRFVQVDQWYFLFLLSLSGMHTAKTWHQQVQHHMYYIGSTNNNNNNNKQKKI